jgi:hydroxyethylthiazole kinase
MAGMPASVSDAPDYPSLAGELLERLRAERIRVHAITNAAAQVFTANLLLAAGGTPSLTAAPDEVAAFTSRSGALLINLGTLDADRRASIPLAIATARIQRKPWVLDPVFVDASHPRRELALSCISRGPHVLRCNAGEFAAIAGTDPTDEAMLAFARSQGTVLALTGPVDVVTDGTQLLRIDNGHPLMAQVTAMGCATTALIAAFAALHGKALEAAAAALIVAGVAGEIAGETAAGPGTFQPAYLDAVFSLAAPTLKARARFA